MPNDSEELDVKTKKSHRIPKQKEKTTTEHEDKKEKNKD